MHQISKKPVSAQKTPLLILLLATLAACETPAEQTDLSCGQNGGLQGVLVGGIQATFDWSADAMDCDSMRRPNNEGIRLRFVGDVSGERLSIIIAMPGLAAGQIDVEVPSNVTASVEGSGRFFSTPDLDSCWTEIETQTELSDQSGVFVVDGALYCIAPLGELNGDAAVTITKLFFSTLMNWN